MGDLTEHFSVGEFVVSKEHPELLQPISDSLTDMDRVKFFYLARMYLEPIRAEFGHPISILSGKRSLGLNKAIKGATNSDHLYRDECAAVDFTCPVIGRIADWLKRLGSGYGQMILYPEKSFVHLSLASKAHFEEKLINKNGSYSKYP